MREDEVVSEISETSVPLTYTSDISTVPSLLKVLKIVKLSEISRKRKMYSNRLGTCVVIIENFEAVHLLLQNRKMSKHSSD